jgi:phosphoribosylglycinamide formyltransferase-1
MAGKTRKKTRIAVFASGNGGNLQALIDNSRDKKLGNSEIALVFSDNPAAYALKRARKAGISVCVLEKTGFAGREEYDRAAAAALDARGIDLVVLAGFMRILSPFFVRKYRGRLINIHPSILPSFKGAHGIKDAYDYGVKISGATVHFVTEDLDAGPIISQGAVGIKEGESADSFERRMHELEHKLYPEAVRLYVRGKLKIAGRKVIIKK